MPTIVAKSAGGPDMPPARPAIKLSRGEAPVQLDFSTCSGQVGVEWANILQGRLVMPSLFQHSDIKILRVRRGAYGSEKAADGRLQTGGIQQEMARMDLALAARFPMTIHVAHHSENPRSSYERAEGALKGRVVVHPMNLFSGGAAEIREKICRVIDDIGPSLVHVHHPHDPIDWEIISHIPKTVPVVASYHGAAAGSVNPHGNQPLRRALTLIGKTLKHYGAERRSGQSPLSALTATGKQVVEFLSRPKLLQQCRLEVTQRASLCQYSCAALTAVSEAGQMDLGELASCVVPPPVDPDFFSRSSASTDHGRSILRSVGIPDDALIILYHARLCEQKGQQILPRIAALLKQAVGSSFAFLIVGPEWQPGMMRMIEQEIMQSGVQENVFVLPGVEQTAIRDLLSVSDISVFPTYEEGLGLTAVEASMMELPVVAHRVGGVPEVVTDRVTGRLVEVGDVESFAMTLAELMIYPELRREYGKRGRQMVQERFSPQSCAERYLEQVCLPLILGSADGNN